jgi:hypothetical protein
MVIVAIIAAAILGTASAALDAARRSRTQSIVLKLHNLIMERWGDYETRRVDISPLHIQNLDDLMQNWVQNGTLKPGEAALVRGQIMADLRLLGLRELMKIEMPDRWSDIALAPVGGPIGASPEVLAARTPLAQRYLRQYQQFDASLDEDVIRSNQGAECLYMTVMYGTGDGEAREQFTDQDIGDTDDDGAPEFLDGWGRPIGFIRWPAGLASPVQPLNPDPITGDLVRDPLNDHDPFDPFRRDSPTAQPTMSKQRLYGNFWSKVAHLKDPQRAVDAGFALVPLIYSIGPDEDADLVVSPLSTGPEFTPSFDPYGLYPLENGDDAQLGRTVDLEDDGEGWHDNIHNHLSEY